MQPDGSGHEEVPGGDYNLLPYPSMPFAYTQPSHLAALAFAVPLQPEVRSLLIYLDGNYDRQMLIEHCVEALRRGEIRLPQAQAGAGSALLHRAASEHVERSLQFLATNGLLEPS